MLDFCWFSSLLSNGVAGGMPLPYNGFELKKGDPVKNEIAQTVGFTTCTSMW
jgi:hypothetical protein